ncbi:MAG: TonB-dependent receptor [Henriciella sp.]|nr:TonB-dependent receptor [Henriciella sp.]MBK76099.1 TonB-dependent receptor [Henriciella sp.]
MRAKVALYAICSVVLLALASPELVYAQQEAGGDRIAREVTLGGGRLDRSLARLSDLYGINILVASSLISGAKAKPLNGRYTFTQALDELIEGHGLNAVQVNDVTVTIVAAEVSPEPKLTPKREPARPASPVSLPRPDPVRREAPVIVTGTRAPARTAFESLAPIDVIGDDDLARSTSDELLDSLSQSLPGFTAFRFPLNDGNIFNRPTALRGLSSDQTLILVNGRRRHRSAFLETSNGQPVDLSQIPVTAIERIEVLRDGASAQYGSDAIGGVINVILTEELEPSAFAQYASYFEGDGVAWRGGARTGLKIGEEGFAVLSTELFDTEPTSRTRQRADAIAFQAANPELDVPNPVQRWGQPERSGWRLGWNSEVPVNGVDLYLFGTFGETHGLSDFNWRNPDVASAFETSPAFPDFDLRQVYPAGFTPRFGQDEVDGSAFFGLRGRAGEGLEWDMSLGYGLSQIDYILRESINASLGPDSPTSFHPGKLRETELVFNTDIRQPIAAGRSAGAGNLAAGIELRRERYGVEAGDLASYAVGPGAIDGLPPGSNGFPGYSPEQTGTFEQDSYAGWVDLEWPLTRAWTMGAALRYENYSIFGDMLTGKASTRFEVTPEWALRATVSTGFRAPTPGQAYTQRTSQSLDTETLDIRTRGRFSPLGPVAEIISNREGVEIRPLEAERSENYSLGFGYRGGHGLSLTVDAFQINVDDRFDLVGGFELTDSERTELAALAPNMNPNISSVGFFQNVYDSRTRGLEIVTTYKRPLGSGDLSLTGAYTTIDSDVTRADRPLDEAERTFFENPVPEHRATISAVYERGCLEWFARLRYYGAWSDVNGDVEADYQNFGGRRFLDLGMTWHVNEALAFKVGAENVFDVYPDKARRQSNRGLIYSRNTPYDTDGGLLYARLTSRF